MSSDMVIDAVDLQVRSSLWRMISELKTEIKMNKFHEGVVFKNPHSLNVFVAGRWPEDSTYPGFGYRKIIDDGLVIERDVEVIIA